MTTHVVGTQESKTQSTKESYYLPLTPLETRVDGLFQKIAIELGKGEAASSSVLNSLFMMFLRLMQHKSLELAQQEVWELTTQVRAKALEKKAATASKWTLVLTVVAGGLQVVGGIANFQSEASILHKLTVLSTVGQGFGKGAEFTKLHFDDKKRVVIEVDLTLLNSVRDDRNALTRHHQQEGQEHARNSRELARQSYEAARAVLAA